MLFEKAGTYLNLTKDVYKRQGYSNVNDYSKYLQGKYHYMNIGLTSMQGIPTTVSVSSAFLQKCMNDPEKAKYLEENLAAIPDCTKDTINGCLGTVTNQSYMIDANGNIIETASCTNDPDGKIAKENAERKAKENREKEEKVKEKRAAKKAEEEKAAKKRAEKSAERKETARSPTSTTRTSTSARLAVSATWASVLSHLLRHGGEGVDLPGVGPAEKQAVFPVSVPGGDESPGIWMSIVFQMRTFVAIDIESFTHRFSYFILIICYKISFIIE